MNNFLPLKYNIETPLNNSLVDNDIILKGWALSPYGIKRIDVYFNGDKYQTITNKVREDIYNLYPDYQSKNSGFEIKLGTSSFIGNSTINIEIIDNENAKIIHNLIIKRNTGSTLYEVSSLKNSDIINLNEDISGYILSNSFVSLTAAIDDKPINIEYNKENLEIFYKFPEYKNENSGFLIKNNQIPNTVGKHTLKIILKESTKTINIIKDIIIPSNNINFELESPLNNSMVKDEVLFQGFYLSKNKIKNINININNKINQFATIDLERPDIYSEYSTYNNKESGWESIINIESLNFGTHPVVITYTDNDGTVSKSNFSIIKSYTPWVDTYNQGDIPSKTILLDEIKANLVNVINDYKGLGVENEDVLIQQTLTLFTGQIIPSNKDWTIITNVLRELAIVKERGEAYDRFISDLDNGLGVSDLYKIKDFINYIQKLGPIESNMSLTLEPPTKYNLKNINVTSVDNFKNTAYITWETEDIPIKKAYVNYDKNPVEDILKYQFNINSGKYTQTITHAPNNPHPFDFNLKWHEWFDKTNVDNAFVKIEHYVMDKRGNRNRTEIITQNFSNDILIPLGPEYYLIETSMDDGAWIPIGKTTVKYFTHNLPEINGKRKYRVKAVDMNNRLETNWLISEYVLMDFLPPYPGTPNPKASPDYNWADITWNKCEYADSYDVYIGTDINIAKKTNGWYFNTKNLKQRMTNLKEFTNYKATVVAINRKGKREKTISFRTKQRTPKVISFHSTGVKVYREAYTYRMPWGNGPWQAPAWRTETSDIMQAEWRETWPDGWQWRSGGAYQAYRLQAWGNNRTIIIHNYTDIRNKLRGKRITKVEFGLYRQNTIHGWPTAQPMHPCNHKHTNANKTGGRPEVFNLRKCDYSVARGNRIWFNDNNTKFLLQQVIDGKMNGIGFHKSYPGATPEGDKAYTRFSGKMEIKVTYFEE